MERIDITPPHDLAFLTQLQTDLENCQPASVEYEFQLKQYVHAETLLRRYAYVLTDAERRIWEQHNGTSTRTTSA